MPQTLYLKYRPQDFDSLVGQEITRVILKNASRERKLSHAYLFTGPRGTGKTSSARIVAKAINCTALKEDGNPCNACRICEAITEGRLVDIIEIDAASHTSVDDVRDLIDKARFMPNEAQKKVYIVDEVHMLSKSAFNALLKTLEEPPEHVHFILATTESHKVPDTIISRCQRFDFKRFEIKDIVYRLKFVAEQEGVQADVKALNLIAKVAEGGLRDALGLFEKVVLDGKITYEDVVSHVGVTSAHVIEGLFDDLYAGRVDNALTKINDLYEGGASLTQFLKDFIEYVRDQFLLSVQDKDPEYTGELVRWIEILENTSQDIKTAMIPQLPLEIAVVKIAGERQELSGEDGAEKKISSKELLASRKSQASSVVEPQVAVSAPNVQANVPPSREEKEETAFSGTVSVDMLREKWGSLAGKMGPKVRHAFKNASPVTLEGDKLTLQVSSQMYLEVLEAPAALAEVEKVLQESFSQMFQIRPVLQKIETLLPDPAANVQPFSVQPTPALVETDPMPKKSMTPEDVAELFGGEVVE